MTNRDEKGHGQRQRSPAYPFLSLQTVVKHLAAFYQKYGSGKVQADVALRDMGYTITSGSGVRALSAFIQFGLFEVDGTQENRRVSLSQLGETILTEPNNRKAIQEAALFPEVHKLIWDFYNLDKAPMPSDSSLEKWLYTIGFSEKAAPMFIRQFKETFKYAFHDSKTGESIKPETDNLTVDESLEVKQVILQRKPNEFASRIQAPYETSELSNWLTQGKEVRIILPKQMNKTDFQILANWLEQLKLAALYEQERSGE